MPDTFIKWDAGWTVLDAAIVLTEGATTENTSAVIDCRDCMALEISIDADYSNDVKATGGLFVYALRDIDGTAYESEADLPWGFEMPFVQSGTRRRTFSVNVSQVSELKLMLDWDNSTSGAVVTVATAYKKATIPVAS